MTVEMVRGLEGKPEEEQLKLLDLEYSLEETEGTPQCGLQYPHGGKWRGRLVSSLS